MPKRNALLTILAVAVLGLVTSTPLAHPSHLNPKSRRRPGPHRREVVVRITDGLVIHGWLLRADKDSIRIEVDGASCPLTFDTEEVASIDFPATSVAQKAPEGSSSQSSAEARETPRVGIVRPPTNAVRARGAAVNRHRRVTQPSPKTTPASS